MAIFPSDRLTTWEGNVGVPGGIPNWTSIYTTLTSATASQVETAMTNAGANQVVYLNAGTHNFSSSQVRLFSENNVVLRGAGMGQTIITGTGNHLFALGRAPWMAEWPSTHAITAGNTQGSTQITVSGGTSGIAVGELMWIEQPNVSGVIPYGSGSGGGSAQLNSDRLNDNTCVVNVRVMVTNIAGSVITFTPPLPFQFDGSPRAVGYGGIVGCKMVGFEDLTMVGSTSADCKAMDFTGCYGCWVKNVEFKTFTKRCVTPSWGACFEMRGCYFHEGAGGHDNGYTIECGALNNSLFENNIWYKCQASHFLQGGCMANVIAYNAVFRTYNQDSGIDWMAGGFVANHSPYPMYNLYEGNYVNSIQPDFYYGGSRYGHYFRNYLPATDVDTTQHRQAVSIDSRQWDYCVVGNILGVNSCPSSITLDLPGVTLNFATVGALSWTYAASGTDNDYAYSSNRIYRIGYPAIGGNAYTSTGNPPAGDATQLNRLDLSTKEGASHGTLIHGNWDAANDAIVWDSGIADHNVPNTLYLTGKPDYFGSLAWPPYDAANPPSSIEDALGRIPAGYRLLNNADPPPSGGGNIDFSGTLTVSSITIG